MAMQFAVFEGKRVSMLWCRRRWGISRHRVHL